MEKQFQLQNNGQAVTQDDVNTWGESAGLADDRVYAELFRMAGYLPGSVAKGVLPSGGGSSNLVVTNGPTGQVYVGPFRVLIGSRTAASTDARANWRDIRSGLSVAEGSTSLGQTVTIFENTSGSPRWDAIVAQVNIDSQAGLVNRRVKNTTTGVVSGVNVSPWRQCFVSITTVSGTPSATPEFPALPADADPVYYVPIAYVYVQNGFNSGSSVSWLNIVHAAPTLPIARDTGASNVSVASVNRTVTTAQQHAWGSSRPSTFLPSTCVGAEELLIALDLNSTAPSHLNGDLVDSRDWRDRMCTWQAVFAPASSTVFPWLTASGEAVISPENQSQTYSPGSGAVLAGFGQSYGVTTAIQSRVLMYADGGWVQGGLPIGSVVQLRADDDTGQLRVWYSGTPNCKAIITLRFFGPLR